MEKMPTHYQSIANVSEMIRKEEISIVDIVNETLERIRKYNPQMNAFITILEEEAMKEAKILDGELKDGKWRGPLHGIPIGIKDFYDTAGIKTTAAFIHLKD